jgi:hypothetical protein
MRSRDDCRVRTLSKWRRRWCSPTRAPALPRLTLSSTLHLLHSPVAYTSSVLANVSSCLVCALSLAPLQDADAERLAAALVQPYAGACAAAAAAGAAGDVRLGAMVAAQLEQVHSTLMNNIYMFCDRM